MNIVNGLFVAAGILGIAMSTAFATSSVTAEDCAMENYEQQVLRYGEQMAAANQVHNQDLYAQARDAQKAAQANVAACAALGNTQAAK
ncbi:MAG: hypothetical protein ACHQAX_04085 [Gammaproteobacteria bacterium]